MRTNRRRVLAAMGTAAVAGLAGCGGGDDGPPTLDAEPAYRGWFEGVDNYEATVDRRDTEEVEVRVGVGPEDAAHFYGPPAVAVTAGTEVQWTWTGQGGRHNVISEDGDFDSGEPVRSDSLTFPHTFEAPAIYRYYCETHRQQGMRGAVFVTPGE